MSATVVLVIENFNSSEAAIEFALKECNAVNAALIVVCIVPLDAETGKMSRELRETFLYLKRSLQRRVERTETELKMHVTGFYTARLLARAIRKFDARLLVMNNIPRLRILGFGSISLAKSMLDFQTCPIFVID